MDSPSIKVLEDLLIKNIKASQPEEWNAIAAIPLLQALATVRAANALEQLASDIEFLKHINTPRLK